MSKLTVIHGGAATEVIFDGQPVLEDVLIQNGFAIPRPCGGGGRCGKCRVELTGAVSEPNEAEKRFGGRLACQVVLLGDARVTLGDEKSMEQIELGGEESLVSDQPMGGRLGIAVDIGTTTLATQLYELKTGRKLAECGMLNPQTSVAADVMGRIDSAIHGGLDNLKDQIRTAITQLMDKLCAQAGEKEEDVASLVITGNTTMLYLLTGRDPEALSHAPFKADCLFDETQPLFSKEVYLPPCMNAFVGADITCASLAGGQCQRSETSLLVDVGTNGEIALWKDGKLYVASTAAGPVFEGAMISCGCGSVRGAIDKVWLEDGEIHAHTIGDEKAVGVCGSGLVDAVAAFLQIEEIDETGACESDRLELRDGIALLPKDVRSVQLAKAAIAAGIQTVMDSASVTEEDIDRLYIAGGFGSHLNVDNAAAIGLLPPALADRVSVLGNAALRGAAMMLLNKKCFEEARVLAKESELVPLGGSPVFNEYYMEKMFFSDWSDEE